MYKYILTAVTAVLMSSTALANGNGPPECGPNGEGPPGLCSPNGSGGAGGDAVADAVAHSVSNADAQSIAGATNVTQTDVSVGTTNEAAASSPGTLILGTCQAGVAAQTQMGGGSLGGPDEVCLYFTLAQMYFSVGDFQSGNAALKRAEDTLRWRNNVVRRAFQAIPLLGRMF